MINRIKYIQKPFILAIGDSLGRRHTPDIDSYMQKTCHLSKSVTEIVFLLHVT